MKESSSSSFDKLAEVSSPATPQATCQGETCVCSICTRHEWFEAFCKERDLNRAAASPATPWQDISTAPERRKVLVTWVNALGKRRTTFASFWPIGTLSMGDETPDDHVDEEGRNVFAGWYEESEANDEDYWRLTELLTHWQPIPAAPALADVARLPASQEEK